jgi:hypothetical protein
MAAEKAGLEIRYQSLEVAQNGVESRLQHVTSENARVGLEMRWLIERKNELYDQSYFPNDPPQLNLTG